MQIKKILLFGKTGQIGQELYAALSNNYECIALNSHDLNFTDTSKIRAVIRKHQPDIIINAAAYTAVDNAEQEPLLAKQINTIAVSVIAEETKRLNAWLIHYSTDYIFDGKLQTPYTETDLPSPLNTYGLSKLAGEYAIKTTNCKHLILRTSWVFSEHRNNFAKTILKLATEKTELKIVADQIGAPTSAKLIADATCQAIKKISTSHSHTDIYSGTYHLTATGVTSWHKFAVALITRATQANINLKLDQNNIIPISFVDYPTTAARPINSRLDTSKFQGKFDYVLPNWEQFVTPLITALKKQGAM